MKTVVRSYSRKGRINYRHEKGIPFAVTGETLGVLIDRTDELLERGYDFKTQIYKVIETLKNEDVGRSKRSLKPSNTLNGDVGVRMRCLKELIYYECMMVKVN